MTVTVNAEDIRASFKEVAAHGEKVAFYFYSDLWAHFPTSRSFFPPDMRIQRDRFVKALIRIVGDVDHYDRLVPYLKELGRNHANRYKVQPHHYNWVGQSLLATLAHFLEDKWTEELERQWREVYTLCARVMLEGAAEGYGQPEEWALIRARRLRRAHRLSRHPGYRSTEVDALSAAYDQAVIDNSDLRRMLEEADEEILYLRETIIARNTDLPRDRPQFIGDDGQVPPPD